MASDHATYTAEASTANLTTLFGALLYERSLYSLEALTFRLNRGFRELAEHESQQTIQQGFASFSSIMNELEESEINR